MRNVQKIPRPIRKILKLITAPAIRKRLHDIDYHSGQVIETYRHHLSLTEPHSVTSAFITCLRVTRILLNRPRILCYPSLPGPGSVFYKLCLHKGYALTDDPSSHFDAAIKWENATYTPNDATLRRLASQQRVLNVEVTDISKSNVIETFEQVFDYSLGVNPHTYEGPILRKSEQNAAHDGTVLQGPLEDIQTDQYVYQRLINNVDSSRSVDLRVTIIGKDIPFVRVKYRPVAKRFDHAGRSQIHDDVCLPGEVLTSEEQERILILCQRMGLDYGELDVLRDRESGRIYIVDVNDTPTGPTFVSADQETIKWCFDTMAEALDSLLGSP